MAKTELKVAPTVETLKPYLDRALNDKEFRDDLKEALVRGEEALRTAGQGRQETTVRSSLLRGSRLTPRCRRTSARRSRTSGRRRDR